MPCPDLAGNKVMFTGIDLNQQLPRTLDCHKWRQSAPLVPSRQTSGILPNISLCSGCPHNKKSFHKAIAPRLGNPKTLECFPVSSANKTLGDIWGVRSYRPKLCFPICQLALPDFLPFTYEKHESTVSPQLADKNIKHKAFGDKFCSTCS